MTVSSKSVASSEDENLPPRILELREKIRNPEYLDFAIQRIAQVLSRKIVEGDEQRLQWGEYEQK